MMMFFTLVTLSLLSCLSSPASAGSIRITLPSGEETYDRASKMPIVVDVYGTVPGPLTAVLRRNGVEVGIIKDDLSAHTGRFVVTWKVGPLLNGSAPDGSGYTIRVRAQDGTIFGESTGSFTIRSPDLFISEVRPELDASTGKIHLWITVKRTGAKLYLEPSEHLYIRIRSRDVDTYRIQDRLITQLNSTRARMMVYRTLRRHSVRAHVTIDPNPHATVVESNEHNNSYDVTLQSGPPAGGPMTSTLPPGVGRRREWHKAFPGAQQTPINPDLRITRARYAESGGKLYLMFCVVNATFDKGSRLDNALARNGLGYSISYGSNWAINETDFRTLNRRGYVDLKVAYTFLGSTGKTITIKIDYDNRVVETNENNNTAVLRPYLKKASQPAGIVRTNAKIRKGRTGKAPRKVVSHPSQTRRPASKKSLQKLSPAPK